MTATHCLVVYSSPVTGREDEYNKWYNERHIPDVLKVPGFLAAQRFKLPDTGGGAPRYVALYEMNTNDPDAVLAELTRRAGTAEMLISDAMDVNDVTLTLTSAASERIAA